MVLPGKRYCEKHELEQSAYNEMRRKRPREQSRLLSQVSNTLDTDITDESNTKKRRTKKLTPKRETVISSPCKKLQNEEATEGCLSPVPYPDIMVHTRTVTGSETFENTSPEGEKALQKKKDESQKPSEAYLSPSEEFSDHPTPSCSGEMAISFLGSDMCGTVLKISDSNTASLSKIKGGEQCASPNNSQKNPDLDYTPHWITSLVGDEMNQQKQEVGKDATTTLERTGGQSEEMVSGTSVEDPKHKASCEEITDVTQTAKESEILVKKTCNFIEDVQTSPVLLEETSHTRMDIRISPDSLLTSQSNMDITLTEASMKRQEVQHSFCLAKFSESFKSHSNIADHCNKSVADEISNRLTVLLESVSEINKKRRMVEMEKKNRGSVIAALQKRLRELEEEILETEREFNRVVAAPWRTEIGFI